MVLTLRECWWPVGPKLAFDQKAVPVPEIIGWDVNTAIIWESFGEVEYFLST
jgi:hypothetical protein